MTDGPDSSATDTRARGRRTMLIAGVLVVALLLVAVGLGAALMAHRDAGRKAGATLRNGAGQPGAAASITTTAGSAASTDTGHTGASTSGGGTPGSTTTSDTASSPPSAPRPSNALLDALKSGQWRLYGPQVVDAGKQMVRRDGVDVQGIRVDCEALTKSGSGYAHATVELSMSASGPAAGKSGFWQVFGTWVLGPDDGTKSGQHYGQGVEGALAARSSVKPPARSGKMTAEFRPIGAYRSKASGVIESGTFTGDAAFEGVLDIPSVPAPPPSKY